MKNKILKTITSLVILILFSNCETKTHDFPPLDKRYWTVEDFENAVNEIMYNYKPEEELPTFNNPETAPILNKVLDTENFKIILNDEELGLKYKNEIGERFFQSWRNISNRYSDLDRKDKYVNEDEHIAVNNFGLELQLYYFKIGNEEIISSTEDPNSNNVKDVVNSNVNTLISNFILHLDEINNENSYSQEGKKQLAERIDTYFSKVVNEYPNSNFDNLKRKSELFIKKTNSSESKESLEKLIKLIESKNKKEEQETDIEVSEN